MKLQIELNSVGENQNTASVLMVLTMRNQARNVFFFSRNKVFQANNTSAYRSC